MYSGTRPSASKRPKLLTASHRNTVNGLRGLPDELLEDIFIHIHFAKQTRLRRTCRRWWRLLTGPHVLRSLTFSVTDQDHSPNTDMTRLRQCLASVVPHNRNIIFTRNQEKYPIVPSGPLLMILQDLYSGHTYSPDSRLTCDVLNAFDQADTAHSRVVRTVFLHNLNPGQAWYIFGYACCFKQMVLRNVTLGMADLSWLVWSDIHLRMEMLVVSGPYHITVPPPVDANLSNHWKIGGTVAGQLLKDNLTRIPTDRELRRMKRPFLKANAYSYHVVTSVLRIIQPDIHVENCEALKTFDWTRLSNASILVLSYWDSDAWDEAYQYQCAFEAEPANGDGEDDQWAYGLDYEAMEDVGLKDYGL